MPVSLARPNRAAGGSGRMRAGCSAEYLVLCGWLLVPISRARPFHSGWHDIKVRSIWGWVRPWNRPPPHLSRRRRSTLAIAPPAPEWCRSAAGTCPSNTPGIVRRAHGRPHARRPLRRQPHGRDRDRRQGRARRRPAHLVQRRLEAAGRPGAVFGPADAAGHLRRRPARLSPRARALPAGRQRRQHREGLRLDRRAHRAGRRRRRRRRELALRAARGAGARGARGAAAADRRRSRPA